MAKKSKELEAGSKNRGVVFLSPGFRFSAMLAAGICLAGTLVVPGFPLKTFAIAAETIVFFWLLLFLFKGMMLSSPNKWIHAAGGAVRHKLFVFALCAAGWFCALPFFGENETRQFLSQCLTFSVWIVSGIALINLALIVKSVLLRDRRARNNAFNFWIQTFVLTVTGALLVAGVVIFEINADGVLAVAIFATVLGWIFQDVIKGIAAFYHMYWNNLIHLGDWIEVRSKGLNGVVVDISLVNVTVKNWDETVSSIPTATLLSEHTVNSQNVLSGKTNGRRMKRDFVIDISSIRPVSTKTVPEAIEKNCGNTVWWPSAGTSALNVTLFRLYLQHWLSNHSKISREPRLLVRLMDPTAEGLPLQVYVFIVDHNFQPFERRKAEITEHVITAMGWFGLRLYQRPAAYDFEKTEKENQGDFE